MAGRLRCLVCRLRKVAHALPARIGRGMLNVTMQCAPDQTMRPCLFLTVPNRFCSFAMLKLFMFFR